MKQRIETIADDDGRAAAHAWLRWCNDYCASRNPLERPIGTPTVKDPDYSELQDARKRLGFRDSWW
ncbi:hypothetical protein [Mycobacterium sp. C31M]